MEIVLTSGVRHPVTGPNPTATAAFATALSGALPPEPDPDAAAAVTTEQEPNRGLPWKLLSLLGAPALAFVGYVTWVGIARGSDGAFAALLGGPFILIGLALVAYAVEEIHRRAVLQSRAPTASNGSSLASTSSTTRASRTSPPTCHLGTSSRPGCSWSSQRASAPVHWAEPSASTPPGCRTPNRQMGTTQ